MEKARPIPIDLVGMEVIRGSVRLNSIALGSAKGTTINTQRPHASGEPDWIDPERPDTASLAVKGCDAAPPGTTAESLTDS